MHLEMWRLWIWAGIVEWQAFVAEHWPRLTVYFVLWIAVTLIMRWLAGLITREEDLTTMLGATPEKVQ